jgi:hypothetical protein
MKYIGVEDGQSYNNKWVIKYVLDLVGAVGIRSLGVACVHGLCVLRWIGSFWIDVPLGAPVVGEDVGGCVGRGPVAADLNGAEVERSPPKINVVAESGLHLPGVTSCHGE